MKKDTERKEGGVKEGRDSEMRKEGGEGREQRKDGKEGRKDEREAKSCESRWPRLCGRGCCGKWDAGRVHHTLSFKKPT
jgi:hypothetical protein